MNRDELQQRGLSLLNTHKKGILNYTMRTGKSKIIIDYIDQHPELKFIWCTPKSKSRDEDIPNEFKKWDTKPCDVICHRSINNTDFDKYDVIILDEIQLVSINNWTHLTKYKDKDIIGLTGTMPKTKSKLNFIENVFKLKILDKLDIDDAVDFNIVSDYEVNVIFLPLNTKKTITIKPKSGKPFKVSEKSNYKYIDDKYEYIKNTYNSINTKLALQRKRVLSNYKSKRDLIRTIFDIDKKTLIFCPNKKIADIFGNPYHSSTDDSNLVAFQHDETKLLSVVEMANDSLTFKNIERVIILQPDRNSLGKFEQRIGRSLLFKEGHKSEVFLLVYENTVEEKWAEMSLENLSNKNWYRYDNKKFVKINRT